jgi:protoporphyrin/coproporphyrin ferrochelatase
VPDTRTDPYDAVLLVSFGGPERPEDVVPFLQNVTRGRGIPDERLAEVGQHYFRFGGRSPINDQCRSLLAALRAEMDGRGIDIPLYWGNRNWSPYLGDTVAEMAAAGHRRAVVITTSAYPSYSSCRQYRENLYDATLGNPAGRDVVLDKIRHYAHHPGFVEASVRATVTAVDALRDVPGAPRLVFVTHAIPTAMATTSGPPPRSADGGYVDWHAAVAAEVTRAVGALRSVDPDWDLVYCSRSGPPNQPWTEPDVNDHLAALHAAGVPAVVCVPIGFVSDHMEVIYDLDTEAAQTAADLGLPFARAATAGVDPEFVSALVDLVVERAEVARHSSDQNSDQNSDHDSDHSSDSSDPSRPEAGEPDGEPAPDTVAVIPGGRAGRYLCLPDCCPNLRSPDRPALCQVGGNFARSATL